MAIPGAAATAPQTAPPRVSTADAAAYQGAVLARIAAQKRYPEAARERAPHVLLDRVAEFLLLTAIMSFRGGDAGEMLALSRLACDVPKDIDDAPVFAAILELLDTYEQAAAAYPGERAPAQFLILAATVARTPDVPVPGKA